MIAGLEKLPFLERTNHLNDRELYAKLWHETHRGETPAIDEIGFTSHLDLIRAGEDDGDTAFYLKYYADDADRELPNHGWTPYADTLLVRMPEDPAERSALFDLMEHVGKPDDDGDDDPLIDGQKEVAARAEVRRRYSPVH